MTNRLIDNEIASTLALLAMTRGGEGLMPVIGATNCVIMIVTEGKGSVPTMVCT